MKYSIVAQGIQEYIEDRREQDIIGDAEMIAYYNSDECYESYDDAQHWIKIIKSFSPFNI